MIGNLVNRREIRNEGRHARPFPICREQWSNRYSLVIDISGPTRIVFGTPSIGGPE